MSQNRSIEKLNSGYDLQPFDCGQEDLNHWFRKFALQGQATNSSQTYLGLDGGQIVGFYSLAAGQIEISEAPTRLLKGIARQPVPVMLLARLAVHKDWQKKGVGRALLRDAVLRTLQAAEIAGIRALVVHAKDEAAKSYYSQFNFVESTTDPFHLCALLKDLRACLLNP
jgi:GNAT superfamily N-acetyltransferase